jgi:hypothetical protein
MVGDVLIAYDRASGLSGPSGTGRVLSLGQSLPVVGGVAPFFDGWAARPRLVAGLLLAVAAVARSRYFRPVSTRLLDPILTSGDGRLRLEAFSSCCGVYARADLLPGALREVTASVGTTNVDLNPEVRDGLARVDDGEEMRLSIGTAGLLVTTRTTAAFERKVRLPTRWVKGLGEAALAQVGMRSCLQVGPAAARRMLAGLPPEGQMAAPPYTVVTQSRDVRFTQRPSADAPAVAGPFRLREMRPLAPFVTGLTVWSRPGRGARPSAWQLDLPGARMWLVLSADVARGFSGEGEALAALTDPAATPEAARLREQLAWSARLDEGDLVTRTGTPADRVKDLLVVLGGQGLVGRDLVEDAWFRRDLPFVENRVARLQPRVRRAAAIPDADLVANAVAGGHEVFVRSGAIEHRVLLIEGDTRCTCVWYVRHHGERGPCRHVLAAQRYLTETRPGALDE